MALRCLLRAVAIAGAVACGTAGAAAPAAPSAAKPAKAAKSSAAKAPAKSSRTAGKTAPKPVEPPLAEATPEQVEAAEQVFYGSYDCEFKQSLDVERNAKHPAYVDVKAGKSTWTMRPALSSTGAIRLQDVKGETLMVQISSKSMLLNVKSAQRIVDDCVSSRQRELIEQARIARSMPGGEPAPLLQAPGSVIPAPAAATAAPAVGSAPAAPAEIAAPAAPAPAASASSAPN